MPFDGDDEFFVVFSVGFFRRQRDGYGFSFGFSDEGFFKCRVDLFFSQGYLYRIHH